MIELTVPDPAAMEHAIACKALGGSYVQNILLQRRTGRCLQVTNKRASGSRQVRTALSPLATYAWITNYQDVENRQDETEAWDEFRFHYRKERRPADGEVTLVERVGNWHAMTADDVRVLRKMLEGRRPSEAIVG